MAQEILTAAEYRKLIGGKRRTRSTKKQESPSFIDEKDSFTMMIHSMFGVQCVKEYRFHPVRRWRFDYCIPEYKIAIEVEGGIWTKGRHINPLGFSKDMEKYNTATSMGYQLIRTTPQKLLSLETTELIKKIIDGSKN